jgi:hypothetical protein
MDHVPMQRLYAPEVRKTHSPNLLTIPVHDKCNKSYQRDEDHFVTALMPHSRASRRVEDREGSVFPSPEQIPYRPG